MERKTFYVQGSGAKPYRVKAEGSGAAFRMFCTCPAGANRNMFCKHAAAMLLGDVTKLRDGSDDPADLRVMAHGSGLFERAMRHRDSGPEELPHLFTIDDLDRFYADDLRALGWEIVRAGENMPDGRAESYALHGRFKNGKLKRGAAHVLRFEPSRYLDVTLDETAVGRVYEGRRERPWSFGGRTWSTLARAAPHFLRAAGVAV